MVSNEFWLLTSNLTVIQVFILNKEQRQINLMKPACLHHGECFDVKTGKATILTNSAAANNRLITKNNCIINKPYY